MTKAKADGVIKKKKIAGYSFSFLCCRPTFVEVERDVLQQARDRLVVDHTLVHHLNIGTQQTRTKTETEKRARRRVDWSRNQN